MIFCSKDKGLRYVWKWSRVASMRDDEELKKWTHFQCSEATVGEWTLEATQWGNCPVYYESSISYVGHEIASCGDVRETGAKTRLEAQIRAEKLFMSWIKNQWKLYGTSK